MCLNCGCGEYEKRGKPSDITVEDLEMAAKGQKMDIREAAANLQAAGRAIEREAQASA